MIERQIKSSLYSPYYAEACNELQGPSPQLSPWATQLRRNVATVASRWRHCVDLTGLGIEPQTYRTDSVRLATELTAGLMIERIFSNHFFVKHQNFFPQNSCVLPLRRLRHSAYKLLYFLRVFCSVVGSAVSRRLRSSVSPVGMGEGGICRDPTILLY